MDWHQRLIPSLCQPPPLLLDTEHRKSVDSYGVPSGRVGHGSNGVVVVYKRGGALYAIKRFHLRRRENLREYMKRVNSEFCIASTVSNHANIVRTFDLAIYEGNYCAVMEYCSGGDLFQSIKAMRMTHDHERDCSFKQLMQGLCFLHSIGVAHRDIKPENLLWTRDGCLKIGDFGTAQVFRSPYNNNSVVATTTRSSSSTVMHDGGGGDIVGSRPYMAVELVRNKTITKPDATDVWSAAIVLYCLYRHGLPWNLASARHDVGFRAFVKSGGENFVLFHQLTNKSIRRILCRMLDLDASKRISAQAVLDDPWCKSIMVCHNGVDHAQRRHRHSVYA